MWGCRVESEFRRSDSSAKGRSRFPQKARRGKGKAASIPPVRKRRTDGAPGEFGSIAAGVDGLRIWGEEGLRL